MTILAVSFICLVVFASVSGGTLTFTAPTGGTGDATVKEGSPGMFVYNVAAGSATTYTLISQNPATPVLFAVDSKNGTVTTSADIDYETIPAKSFILKINASSATGSATATLNVTITDVNEHTPQFSSAAICAAVPSNATKDTTVGTYTATDADSTATITYKIASGDDSPAKFSMALATGILTTTGQAFNKTAKAVYSLVITASDGTGTGSKIGTATVNITLDGDGSCSSNPQLNKKGNGNKGNTMTATAFIGFIFVFLQLI